jgi:hypothetical protein
MVAWQVRAGAGRGGRRGAFLRGTPRHGRVREGPKGTGRINSRPATETHGGGVRDGGLFPSPAGRHYPPKTEAIK